MFERAARDEQTDGAPGKPGGFPRPDREFLKQCPWGGEGPDPLEELWEQS